jgi:hypothetical protein
MDLSTTAGVSELSFKEEKTSKFGFRHAIEHQTEAVSKIIFHFTGLSPKLMGELSRFMHSELAQKMKPTSAIKAGVSPEYRGQWDLILFFVPNFEVQMTHDAILSLVRRFGES